MKITQSCSLAILAFILSVNCSFDINMSEDQFDEVLKSGSMDGYFTYDEFYQILDQLRADPENRRYVSDDQVFGRTYENRNMAGYYFTDDTSQLENYLSHKNIVLINALHHSREPLTLTMVLLMTWELLKRMREPRHSKLKEFLRDNVIFFIPIVNIDSYIFINRNYYCPYAPAVRMIRKNRRIHPQCNEITGGIDLNRNYDFQFGLNEQGSSSNPCAEDFRGERPFSEPETSSIKKYVDDHINIISAVNVHTYGNSWIYPYNYVSDKTDHFLQLEKRLFYDFFKEFEQQISDKNIRALFGNAAFALDYPTNGEAGDWFMGKKNILNIDVELGNQNPESEQFYPPRAIIPDIVRYNWIVMKQFLYKHIIDLVHKVIIKPKELIIEIQNKAISNLIDFEASLTPDIALDSSNYKLTYSLKELPDFPETTIPVIDNQIATTLKGRHILAIQFHFCKATDVKLFKGLDFVIRRNSSFLHYPDQKYYFRVSSR